MKKLSSIVFSVLGTFYITFTLHADTFTTLDGEQYSNASVKRAEPDGLLISYPDGVVKLKFKNLPQAIRIQYRYNPATEELYLAQKNSNEVAAYQAIILANEDISKKTNETLENQSIPAGSSSAQVLESLFSTSISDWLSTIESFIKSINSNRTTNSEKQKGVATTACTTQSTPKANQQPTTSNDALWDKHKRSFLIDFHHDGVTFSEQNVMVDFKDGYQSVRIFMTLKEVRSQFTRWDIHDDIGYLIPDYVSLITRLIVSEILLFNKNHGIPNTGQIVGSLGVIGTGVTGAPKSVLVGSSYYIISNDEIIFRPENGIRKVILSMYDGSISLN